MLRANRWLAGLMVLAGCAPVACTAGGFAAPAMTAATPASVRPANAATARVHARTWLAADPTIEPHPGIYRLNNRPQLFNAKFSAPMDRASAERAFQQNLNFMSGHKGPDAPTTASLGVSFDWHNDQFVEVRVERPHGTFTLSFVGARTRDGRPCGTGNDPLTVSASRPQRLRRLALDGRELGAWPVENEVMDFGRIYENKFGVAWRRMIGPDGDTLVPFLAELEHNRLATRMIPGTKDGIWSLFAREEYSPATRSLIISGPDRITSHSLESIRKGRPGRVLYQVKNGSHARVVAMRLADDGERIAVLLGTPDRLPYEDWCHLTLLVLDPAGRELLKRKLPVDGSQSENGPIPVALEWFDAHRLLIKLPAAPRGPESGSHVFCYDPQKNEMWVVLASAEPFRKSGRWVMSGDRFYPADSPEAGEAQWTGNAFQNLSNVGRMLAVGRDRLLVEENPFSEHPRVSLIDPARGATILTWPGRLAGADKSSAWVAASE